MELVSAEAFRRIFQWPGAIVQQLGYFTWYVMKAERGTHCDI